MDPFTIAGFTQLEHMGEDPVGVIYRAKHIATKQSAVIKILNSHLTSNRSLMEEISRQVGEAARSLQQSGIVPIKQVGLNGDGTGYFLMVSEPARLLETVIHEGKTDLSQCLSVLQQLSLILDYAHEINYVHGAIHPSNIMMRTDGKILLMGFGLLRAIQHHENEEEEFQLSPTEYLSPEQCNGAPADYISDVYSLGVVMYELLGGVCPFSGGNALEVARAIKYTTPDSLINHRPQISTAVEQVVMRAMAREPEERFSSAGQFYQAYLYASSMSGLLNTPSGSVVLNSPTKHLVVPPPVSQPVLEKPTAITASDASSSNITLPLVDALPETSPQQAEQPRVLATEDASAYSVEEPAVQVDQEPVFTPSTMVERPIIQPEQIADPYTPVEPKEQVVPALSPPVQDTDTVAAPPGQPEQLSIQTDYNAKDHNMAKGANQWNGIRNVIIAILFVLTCTGIAAITLRLYRRPITGNYSKINRRYFDKTPAVKPVAPTIPDTINASKPAGDGQNPNEKAIKEAEIASSFVLKAQKRIPLLNASKSMTLEERVKRKVEVQQLCTLSLLHAEQALKMDPRNGSALYARALAYESIADHTRAEQSTKDALKVYPSSAELQNLLNVIHKHLK